MSLAGEYGTRRYVSCAVPAVTEFAGPADRSRFLFQTGFSFGF